MKDKIETDKIWIDVETLAILKNITKRAVRLSLNKNKYEYIIENVKGGKTYKIKLSSIEENYQKKYIQEMYIKDNYINSEQAQTQIDNSISGKVDTDIFTAYTASTKTEIDNAVSVKADSSRVDEIEEVTASALVELHSTKQDILVSGTNIKTINNQSLLGSGNIEIQGGSGSDYSAGTNIDITNKMNEVFKK